VRICNYVHQRQSQAAANPRHYYSAYEDSPGRSTILFDSVMKWIRNSKNFIEISAYNHPLLFGTIFKQTVSSRTSWRILHVLSSCKPLSWSKKLVENQLRWRYYKKTAWTHRLYSFSLRSFKIVGFYKSSQPFNVGKGNSRCAWRTESIKFTRRESKRLYEGNGKNLARHVFTVVKWDIGPETVGLNSIQPSYHPEYH